MQLKRKKDIDGSVETTLEWQGSESMEHLEMVLNAIFGSDDLDETEIDMDDASIEDSLLAKVEQIAQMHQPATLPDPITRLSGNNSRLYGTKFPMTLKEIYEIYQQRYSCDTIGRAIGCPGKTISGALGRNGFEMRDFRKEKIYSKPGIEIDKSTIENIINRKDNLINERESEKSN